jgi:hypothetical protein
MRVQADILDGGPDDRQEVDLRYSCKVNWAAAYQTFYLDRGADYGILQPGIPF